MEPLTVPAGAFDEPEGGSVCRRVCRAVVRVLRDVATGGVPIVRRKLDKQMELRDRFPQEEWRAKGIDPHGIMPILQLIQSEMDWPNGNFLPDDPLELVFVEDNYGFGCIDFLKELDARYGVSFSDEEIARIRDSKWTLEKFVSEVARRT